MKRDEELKAIVKNSYSALATLSEGANCCCGTNTNCTPDFTTFSEDYSQLPGYNAAADLKLGCGIPTETARLQAGNVVVDLGSGAGNDAFVARALVGESGRVIGIDMTEAMIERARANAAQAGFTNVEFRLGEIENIPIADNTADVVISNCVLNLVPNKEQAFLETYRILKPQGHFSISDVVLSRPLPESAKTAAELYAGCVSGALLRDEYLALIEKVGFKNITVLIEKPLHIPSELLQENCSAAELSALEAPLAYSITVFGEKP